MVFEIVDEPVDCEANVGETATFTVNATGVASYTWQYRTRGATNWKTMYSSATGADTATLTTEVTTTRYTYEYRCKLTGEDGTTLHTAIVQIVEPPVVFEIVDEPVDCEANVGETATFTVNATGVASYTWQYRTRGATNWKTMYSSATGADTATLTTEVTTTRYTYEYRCKLTGEDGTTLHTAIVQIVEPPVVFEIVDEPVDCEANVGEEATFTVNATGVASYTWQYRTSSTGSWRAMYSSATGADTATLTTEATATRYNYEYRCKLTGEDGTTLTTVAVKIVKPDVFVIDDVTYVVLENGTGVAVAKYEGTASSLTIPTTVEGYTVVEIGEKAFYGNTALTSISLPNNITVIRKQAFAGCSSLSSMTSHD